MEISSVSSWLPFQNAGTCVANSVVAVAVFEPTGYVTFALKVPCTASPLVVTSLTFPALTSEMKNGLKGIVTRGCVAGSNSSTESQLSASSATMK